MNVHPLPAADATLWSRLIHTPLFEVLRGRLTGSLDLRRVIAAAALPAPVADLIRTVARRTRLWRVERVEVARELVEHFRDGLAAGQSAEQLVALFGDPRRAARLIRRAKLRGRPLFWRILRRAVQGLAAVAAPVVVCYLFLTVRLLAHHPTIAHNYQLDLIAPTLGVAEGDRAWPLYREALLQITPEPVTLDTSNAWPETKPDSGEEGTASSGPPTVPVDVTAERTGSENWATVERWLAENQAALEKAREGAKRPRFGFVYNDPADRTWMESQHLDPKSIDPNEDRQLITFSLPQIHDVRRLARLLEANARRALAAGDRESFLGDVGAMIGIADQLEEDLAHSIVDLIAYFTLERALDLVDEALISFPGLLRDEDLSHLAHRIAGYAGGRPIVPRLAAERQGFHDFVQRIYSDDGRGGGVMTYDGLKMMESLWHELGQPTPIQILVTSLVAPLAGGYLSRQEMIERGDAVYDRAASEIQRPLWQWESDDYEQQLRALYQNPLDRVRYAPLMILMPAMKNCYSRAQWLVQKRDATLVGLALTLFHRRHGAWPERLDELVPDLLPAIPADRFTGEPLRYRVVDGEPLLYSVGPDKEDNGGQAPDGSEGKRDDISRAWANPGMAPAKSAVGLDWVLWPPEVDSHDKNSAPGQSTNDDSIQ